MQKQLYLLYLLTCCSYSNIAHTTQSKIILMSQSSNDKNKCYITAKHHNIIVDTLTASLIDQNYVYHIEIAPAYENTGIACSLIRAMGIELKTKNPHIDFTTLKIKESTL